jgi:hypothetical protein
LNHLNQKLKAKTIMPVKRPVPPPEYFPTPVTLPKPISFIEGEKTTRKQMSKLQFRMWHVMLITAVFAATLAYVFRPLREVIYVPDSKYTGESETVEFVESRRRMKTDIAGRVGDKFMVQSWMK